MLKKYIAISLLCIANLLLVGHSIVPHHHSSILNDPITSEVHEKRHHHHDHDHHHNHHQGQGQGHHGEQDSDLGDLFAHMQHSTDYLRKDNDGLILEKSAVAKFHLSQETIFITIESWIESGYNKDEIPFYRDPDYYPPPNFYRGLRAPPVLFS